VTVNSEQRPDVAQSAKSDYHPPVFSELGDAAEIIRTSGIPGGADDDGGSLPNIYTS
jgi:hypothetical protein